MTEFSDEALKAHLAELGARIHAKVDELGRHGIMHGDEREKAADLKLKHLSLKEAHGRGDRPMGELARDVEILKASFERWVARVDKSAER